MPGTHPKPKAGITYYHHPAERGVGTNKNGYAITERLRQR